MTTPLERAEDAGTPPEELARLSLSRDADVRAAVARNPNTPLETLQRSMLRHADAVLENSILDFLGLEDANWVHALPAWARGALLRSAACPPGWLRAALDEHAPMDDALMAAQNLNLAGEALQSVIAGDAVVVETLHLHVAAKPVDAGTLEARRVRAALNLERDVELLKDASSVGLLEPWVLEVCARAEDLDLALLAARHPRTDAATLEGLALHADSDVRATVLTRELPADLRAWLEGLERAVLPEDAPRLMAHAHGRWLVARRSAEIALLEAVAADPDWRVRQACAQNPHADTATLEKLSSDVDKDVRVAVAAHPRTGRSALARLMLDAEAEVCAAARANPSAPRALEASLRKLEENDPTLSGAVLERLSRRDDRLAQLAAAHVGAAPALLRALSAHSDWQTRRAVARHNHTPQDVLEGLALDSDYDVRATVAVNARTPSALLEAAARDAHPIVRSGAALAAHAPLALLERLALDSDADVRQAVAVNPRTPLGVLEDLAADAHEGVRRAVALHPQASPAILERLSSDPDETVRAVVADHPNAGAGCAAGLFGAAFEWRDLYSRVRALGDVTLGELRQLAGLNAFAVGLALAHPRCPLDVLERLSANETWTVRQRVAAHPTASTVLLERLSEDADHDVRCAVATNPNVPAQIFARLAADDSSTVRVAVALRVAQEPELLSALETERLAWDVDDAVVEALGARADAARHLRDHPRGTPLEPHERALLGEIGTPLALKLVARDAATDAAALRALCANPDWRVRVAVAEHARSDAETLEVLTDDPDPDVRRALAHNPVTPAPLLRRLARDADMGVVRAALEHPAQDPEFKRTARNATLARLLTGRGLSRVVALGSPFLSRVEFAKTRNLHSPAWLERLALAHNPALPREILETLSKDANQFVRLSAQRRLETQP